MAQTTAKVLWDNFIVHYGLLEGILLDQGRNSESELIANLCRLTSTQKLRTSPYYPQTNGQCERFSSTSINMFGKFPLEHKSDWKGSPIRPKLRGCIWWAHKQTDLFQQKEAQCHKQNYDRHSTAVSLRMGDTVLVCVTAFKGRQIVQSRWENREYVVEWKSHQTCQYMWYIL